MCEGVLDYILPVFVLRAHVRACVRFQAVTNIPELAGVSVPNIAFVYTNYNDHAFSKV